MKIIGTDIFDRDTRSDVVIAENVPEHFATKIVKFINFIETEDGDYSGYFYVAKPDDYKPYKWEP